MKVLAKRIYFDDENCYKCSDFEVEHCGVIFVFDVRVEFIETWRAFYRESTGLEVDGYNDITINFEGAYNSDYDEIYPPKRVIGEVEKFIKNHLENELR